MLEMRKTREAKTAENKSNEKIRPDHARTNATNGAKASQEQDQRVTNRKEDQGKKLKKKLLEGDGTKKSRETKDTKKKERNQKQKYERTKGCKERKENRRKIITATEAEQAVHVGGLCCRSEHDRGVDKTPLENLAIGKTTRKTTENHHCCRRISKKDKLHRKRNKQCISNGRDAKEQSITKHVVKEPLGKELSLSAEKQGTGPWASQSFASLDEETFGDLLKTSDELTNFFLEIENDISQLEDIQQQIQIGREDFDMAWNEISTDLSQVSSTTTPLEQQFYDLVDSQDSEERHGKTPSTRQKHHLHTAASDRGTVTLVEQNPYSALDSNRASPEECTQQSYQQTKVNKPNQSRKTQGSGRQNRTSRHKSKRQSRSSRSVHGSSHRSRRSLDEFSGYSRTGLEESSSSSKRKNLNSRSRRSKLMGQKQQAESSLLNMLHKQVEETDNNTGSENICTLLQPTLETDKNDFNNSLTLCSLMNEEDSDEESVATKETSVSERSLRALLNLSQKLGGSYDYLEDEE